MLEWTESCNRLIHFESQHGSVQAETVWPPNATKRVEEHQPKPGASKNGQMLSISIHHLLSISCSPLHSPATQSSAKHLAAWSGKPLFRLRLRWGRCPVVSGVPSGLPGLAEVDPAVLVLILGFPPRDPDGPEDHVGSELERGARKKGPSQTRLWTLLSRGRTLIWRASGPSNP